MSALDLRDDLRAIVLRAMTASTGVVSRTREQIVDEAIGAMEELGACDPMPIAAGDPSNPFIGVNADAMAIIGTLLGKAYQSENEGAVMDWIDQWRAARGEAAFDRWRWWIGEVDGETYALDYATRDAAVADAPRAIRAGDFVSPDGSYQIIEARGWADEVQAADDISWFAERRNKEILHSGVKPGAAQ